MRLAQLAGMTSYEMRMQWRRGGLWVAMGIFAVALFLSGAWLWAEDRVVGTLRVATPEIATLRVVYGPWILVMSPISVPWLVLLLVLPQWQGRGAARDLITAVIEMTRTEGAKRIVLSTSNDDLPALGLYQRLGFVITNVLVGKILEHHGGVELGFAGIPVRDEIQMELLL